MEIDIHKLRLVTESIFDHIEADLGVTSVSLDSDHYWVVPDANLYSMEKESPKLDIGQLTEDLSFLEDVLEDKDRAVSNVSAFGATASLPRAEDRAVRHVSYVAQVALSSNGYPRRRPQPRITRIG